MCNEHCLVEIVAGDLLQEIADPPGAVGLPIARAASRSDFSTQWIGCAK
jgi:hypothetical protein